MDKDQMVKSCRTMILAKWHVEVTKKVHSIYIGMCTITVCLAYTQFWPTLLWYDNHIMAATIRQYYLCRNGGWVLADLFRLLLLDPLVGSLEVVRHLGVDGFVHLLLSTGCQCICKEMKWCFWSWSWFEKCLMACGCKSFCNIKNSQEMFRNDWLACMMARMIISASSFASAWKVINYHTHTFFEIQQVFIFICYSFTNKFALLPVGQGWGRPSSPGSLPWSSPHPPERKIMILG